MLLQEEEKSLFDKRFTCPCCEAEFKAKHVKSGGVKLDHTEFDLRPVYKGLDALKYDVVFCNNCGYAALERYFNVLRPAQRMKVEENVCSKYKKREVMEGPYTYEYAVERYKLALYCTIQKVAEPSEIGYVCLKLSWLLQNMADSMEQNPEEYKNATPEKIEELRKQADTYEVKSYSVMYKARMEENFPICGMDEVTFDYLVAALAYKAEKYDVAMRMLSGVSSSREATDRVKNKAYDLKQMVSKKVKEQGKAENADKT
jgi:hypothetical protein